MVKGYRYECPHPLNIYMNMRTDIRTNIRVELSVLRTQSDQEGVTYHIMATLQGKPYHINRKSLPSALNLTHFRAAMPFGNIKIYFREFFQFRIVTI